MRVQVGVAGGAGRKEGKWGKKEEGGGSGRGVVGGGGGGVEVGKGGNKPRNCFECRTIFDKDKRFGEQTREQSFNDP